MGPHARSSAASHGARTRSLAAARRLIAARPSAASRKAPSSHETVRPPARHPAIGRPHASHHNCVPTSVSCRSTNRIKNFTHANWYDTTF